VLAAARPAHAAKGLVEPVPQLYARIAAIGQMTTMGLIAAA